MEQVVGGDWPEDFSHENGNYNCICCDCGGVFTGHKRRVVCRKCSSKPPQSSQPKVNVRELVNKTLKDSQ